MLTEYITSVTARFSPFNSRSGKTARNFLAYLPPNARTRMAIDIQMLPSSAAAEPASLVLSFKDGKEIRLDLEKMKIRDIQEEVARHSRVLKRKDELTG